MKIAERITKSKDNLAAHAQKAKKGIDFSSYLQMVEKKAYELYDKRGRLDGYDWEDWFQAEKAVEEELSKQKV